MSLTYGEQGQYIARRGIGRGCRESPGSDSGEVCGGDCSSRDWYPERSPLAKTAKALFDRGEAHVFLIMTMMADRVFIAANGPRGRMSLYHNLGNANSRTSPRKPGSIPTSRQIGCTAGDYDNDGFADLALSINSGSSFCTMKRKANLGT